MLKKITNLFSKAWLYESIILIALTVSFTVGAALATDTIYTKTFAEKINAPTSNAQAKPKLVLEPSDKANAKNTGVSTAKTKKTSKTVAKTSNTTNTSTGGNNTIVTPPSNSPPPPPTEPLGCFVIVSGYKYNLQSIVGIGVTDQTSGKKKSHSSATFQCGTFSNPTNMTSTYLSKHSGLGCWQRIAPYIVTPPAPTDSTC